MNVTEHRQTLHPFSTEESARSSLTTKETTKETE